MTQVYSQLVWILHDKHLLNKQLSIHYEKNGSNWYQYNGFLILQCMSTCFMFFLILGGFGGPPSGIDPQIYQWFLTVDQDKSGHITAHELQQALVNGNWSHFNPETCRLMISK